MVNSGRRQTSAPGGVAGQIEAAAEILARAVEEDAGRLQDFRLAAGKARALERRQYRAESVAARKIGFRRLVHAFSPSFAALP